MKNYKIALLLGLVLSHTVTAAPMPGQPVLGYQQIPVTNTRCNLSASSSTLDYGGQSRWQLKDVDGSPQLLSPGKRQLMLNVSCPYSQEMKLRIHGASVAAGDFRYGASGRLRVTVTSAQLDGQNLQVAQVTPEGALKSTPATQLELHPSYTVTPVAGNQPATGKLLNLQIEIEPILTDSMARVASSQNSESDLTFELID